jgi:hypothetical protein
VASWAPRPRRSSRLVSARWLARRRARRKKPALDTFDPLPFPQRSLHIVARRACIALSDDSDRQRRSS